MSKIEPAAVLIAAMLLGGFIDNAAAAKKSTPSRASTEARQRNCYAEAERRYPDSTSPNTARSRQMWVYACWQGVKP